MQDCTMGNAEQGCILSFVWEGPRVLGSRGGRARSQARINKEAPPGFQATQAGLLIYEGPDCKGPRGWGGLGAGKRLVSDGNLKGCPNRKCEALELENGSRS